MRVVLAGVLAGVILFGWSAVSWMLLPFHEQVLRPIQQPRDKVVRFLSDLPEGGVFHYPGFPTTADGSRPTQAQFDAAFQQMRDGPVVSKMVFLPAGAEPFPPQNFAIGLAVHIAAGCIAAGMLRLASGRLANYGRRVLFVFGFGVVTLLARFVPESVWWGYPIDYAAVEAGDILTSWLLAGLVLGAMIRGRPELLDHSDRGENSPVTQ